MRTDYFAGDSRTDRERMLAGDLYIADDPENARIAKSAMRLCHEYHQAVIADDKSRSHEILRQLLGSLGEGTWIKPPISVDYGENIHIGARTFINSGLTALDVARITIGAERATPDTHAPHRPPASPRQTGSGKTRHPG